jgi:hypothetical protein
MKAKFIFLNIICGALFISCASRKVDIKTTDIKKDSLVETKIELTENKVKDSTAETNTKTIINIDEIIIKPIDSLKEFIVEGKTYKNVVLSYKKTKTNSLYNNKIKVSQNASKHVKTTNKVQTSTKENIKQKEIDKKANYFIYIYFIIGIIILYIIYKYKRFII